MAREENDWHWMLDADDSVQNQVAREELVELKEILAEVGPKRFDKDDFVWPLDGLGEFMVRKYYRKLIQDSTVEVDAPNNKEALNVVWNSWMPSKVKSFAWRLINNRHATRSQLVNRGMCLGVWSWKRYTTRFLIAP